MIENFLEKLSIPLECRLNNTIYKKLFYENASMNKRDKEIFTNNIDKIIWLYSLKKDTINIKPYKDEEKEYEEVEFIQVNLNSENKYKNIAEIIQRTIPYPMILIFTFENKILLNAAQKRVNRTDESRNTIEEFIYTDWIDLSNLAQREEDFINNLNIRKLSFINFYKFYSSFVDKINLFNASKYNENFNTIEDKNPKEIKEISDKIARLDMEISNLKNGIKKEVHFNKKVEMNINIKKLKGKRQVLISKLDL